MTPYYEQDGITIYHGDCREVLPTLRADAVVSDPPYGINWVPRVHNRVAIIGDDEPFDPAILLSVGTQHIVWGGNYFAHALAETSAWIVWVKREITSTTGSDKTTSDCEMAWTDLGGPTRVVRHIWDGWIRQGEWGQRNTVHPAQKPVEVMAYCVNRTTGVVVDPFMGSGSTLVAAKHNHRKAIGIEIEERYCEIAAKRLSQGVLPMEASA